MAAGDSAPLMRMNLDHPNHLEMMSPWQMDFRQIEPGELKTSIATRVGNTVSVLNFAVNLPVHQRGVSPDGWSTFGISRSGTVPLWQGQNLNREAFLSFGDNDGFDGVTSHAFSGNVVSIQSENLEDFARACGFSIEYARPEARNLLSDTGAAQLAALEETIKSLLSKQGQVWTSQIEEQLMIDVLLLMTSSSTHDDRSLAGARRRALHAALERMNEAPDEPISVKDLCLESGASWRTLDRAFKEAFGLGPKQYCSRLRLSRVRQKLLKNPLDASIADVANENGFWHLGQFAKDYRLFFGELPSETVFKKPSDHFC